MAPRSSAHSMVPHGTRANIFFEEITGEAGAKAVLEALETVFGEPQVVLLIETVEVGLYSIVRNGGENIVAFQSRLDMLFKKLETSWQCESTSGGERGSFSRNKLVWHLRSFVNS